MITVENITPSNDLNELKALVKLRCEILDEIRSADEIEKAAIAKAKADKAEQTKFSLEQIDILDSRLTKLLISRKKSLTARFGKTITLPGGVIRYRIDAKSLETPKAVVAIINFLLGVRGGKRYLTFTPTLNRDAITNAGESLHRKLWPFGAWVGKHATISIKSTGESGPKTLDSRRYRFHRSK
jgi:hypothetical protein